MLARIFALGIALSLVMIEPVGAEPSAEPGAGSSTAEADAEQVTVRIGRALDFEGKPVYFTRSAFSETASVALFSTRPIQSRRRIVADGTATAPLASATLTSRFGMRGDPWLGTRRFHAGIDLAAPAGTPIRATNGGVVMSAGWRGGYGLRVAIGHSGGRESRYGHLSRVAVRAGQVVEQGETIGYVGSTGRSTGPHLHYEQRVNGQAVSPQGVGK